MKILLASDAYSPMVNGVVVSTQTLKRGLEELGHEVRVLALGTRSYFDRATGTYYQASLPADRFYPEARIAIRNDRQVLSEVLAWGPDLIHTQTEFSTFQTAKRLVNLLGVPWVHTYHTAYENYTHYGRALASLVAATLPRLTRMRLRGIDLVITPTDKTQASLRSMGVERNIRVIPTGIDLAGFSQTSRPETLAFIRRGLDIKEDDLTLLFVGRLGQEKNLEEALTYLARLGREDIKFIIVGYGPLYEDLKALVRELGLDKQVSFTGRVDHSQVPAYYQIADLFFSASTSETQGLTYIEALASGLPVLAHSDPAQEGVLVSLENSYRYQGFSDFEDFILAYKKDKDLRARLREGASQGPQEALSARAFAKKVEEAYLEVMGSLGYRRTRGA